MKVQGSITGKNGEGLPQCHRNRSKFKTIGGQRQPRPFFHHGSSGSTLQFSYVGYFNRLQKVTSAALLNIQLADNPNYQQMGDVVIVGYGKQKITHCYRRCWRY